MDKDQIISEINRLLLRKPEKIIVSNPRNRGEEKYIKIVVNSIILKGENCYQIEQYTEKQVFHQNVSEEMLIDDLIVWSRTYKQINFVSSDFDAEIKFNKKLDFVVNLREKEGTAKKILPKTNNRRKNYILEEGMEIPVFVELGIFTSDFKVVNSKYDKFKQINRFAEILSDVIKDYPKKKINIIDFGCGKSYLTFVVYYYLTNIKGIDVNIIGLDLKEDVIEKCNKLARRFGYDNLRFEMGDINGYKAPFDVDMVMTLHACDVATDYALFNAISWNSEIILSVPCCQHEINKQLKSDRLSAMTKYGIIKERTSALITDAVRGCLLEYSGYKTDVMEFVDIEHSPKNILIRARKGDISENKRKKSLLEAKMILEEFDSKQTLYGLLVGNETGVSETKSKN